MNHLQQLFYSTRISGDKLYLEDQEAAHCSLVLRKRIGDIIQVIDGRGKLYKCGIDVIGKREVECTILNVDEKEKCTNLSLAIAPTKNRDRLEWLIEKVVEIGVEEVFFINTERTERSKINMERIQKKAIGAMKQSLRFYLPSFTEIAFKDLIHKEFKNAFIAHCIDGYQMDNLKDLVNSESRLVLIGPEGDFTPEEVESAIAKGFKSLGLGKSRLRTETAAIAAAVLCNI